MAEFGAAVPDSVIKVSGVSKTYASGFEALRGIDLEIRRGEIFALLGPNGAGKTTLISIICGLVTPTAGRVTADGHDIAADYRAARAAIGLVPQDPMVSLNPTQRIGRQIAEALVLAKGARYKGVDADVSELLAQVGLDNPQLRARQYPHELSGGMRQRVGLARAIERGTMLSTSAWREASPMTESISFSSASSMPMWRGMNSASFSSSRSGWAPAAMIAAARSGSTSPANLSSRARTSAWTRGSSASL